MQIESVCITLLRHAAGLQRTFCSMKPSHVKLVIFLLVLGNLCYETHASFQFHVCEDESIVFQKSFVSATMRMYEANGYKANILCLKIARQSDSRAQNAS